MRKPSHEFFTVYDAKTDEILACGSRRDVCRILNKSSDAFGSLLSLVKSGKNRKFTITKEDPAKKTYTVYGAGNTGDGRGRPSKADYSRVLEMYNAGYNDREIANAVGVSPKSICDWRWRRGLPTVVIGRPRKELSDMSITEETRRDSHEAIKPKKELRRQEIMDAIIEHGPMTADELMDLLGYHDPNRVRPRLTELTQSGALCTIGKRQSRRSGRLVAVWAIAAPCNEQKSTAPGAVNTEGGKQSED